MKFIVQELQSLVAEYSSRFTLINDSDFSNKPLPNTWSKKEVVGHLIDSAQNNLRRFIVGQYEAEPAKIIYDQDFWVSANGYQQMKKDDIIALWSLLNLRICSILETMPIQNQEKEINTGKSDAQLHSLHWLAEDYVKHLKHHLNQIIPGSFDIIYH